jgi:lysozyme family protein
MLIICEDWLGKILLGLGAAKEFQEQKAPEPTPVPTVPPRANTGTPAKPDFQWLWDNCTNDPEDAGYIANAVSQLKKNESRYAAISKATGVPWQVIAVIHKMESNCDFSAHMHNGDPLTARTVQVPAGRPVNSKPPFTFEESAIDALGYDGATGIKVWHIVTTLQFLERYNGLGYRTQGIYSPYLWAGSNIYKRGKYTSDGVYDANAVSMQLGCVPMLKGLGYAKA